MSRPNAKQHIRRMWLSNASRTGTKLDNEHKVLGDYLTLEGLLQVMTSDDTNAEVIRAAIKRQRHQVCIPKTTLTELYQRRVLLSYAKGYVRESTESEQDRWYKIWMNGIYIRLSSSAFLIFVLL